VLRIVVRDADARSLRSELADTIEHARPLLAEAIAVLDLRECEASDVDPGEIVEAVRAASIRLAAVLIGESSERGALASLGLPVIETPLSTREGTGRAAIEDHGTANRPEAAAVEQTIERPVAEPLAQPGAHSAERTPAPPAAPPPIEPPAHSGLAPLYLTRPLRSGQRLYAQGRDAVVAAPTSRGSELIADGSIYAFSPLRGRVLAGASGDTQACIVASHLDAELVAVAGVYRTFEPDDLKALGSGPVSVTLWLDADGNERLTLAPLAPSASMQLR
jgi:septum site-determining protein MinC